MKYSIFKGARDKIEIEIDEDDCDKVERYNWSYHFSKFSGTYQITGYKKGDLRKVYILGQILMNTTNLIKYKDDNILNNSKSNLEII